MKNKNKKSMKKMLYKEYKNTHDLTKFETIWTFSGSVMDGIIIRQIANNDQNKLSKTIIKLIIKTRPSYFNMRKIKMVKIAK